MQPSSICVHIVLVLLIFGNSASYTVPLHGHACGKGVGLQPPEPPPPKFAIMVLII